MNPRNLLNLVLAFVVLGLGAAVWLSQREESPATPERITTLTEADVTRIEIHSARHADAVLERRGTEWWLVEPFMARADRAKIDAAFGLLRARSLARYPAAAVTANQAGLDEPDLRLRADDTELVLGGTEALGGRRYVGIGGSVHLIVDRYSHLLRGGPASLVSPRLLPTGARLREIRLPGLHLLQGDGQWQLAGGGTASSDALRALVDEWRHARALRVSRGDADAVGEVVTLSPQGDAPPLRFVLQRGDGEILLTRGDLGLSYHFTPDVAARLLALPSVDNEGDGDGNA